MILENRLIERKKNRRTCLLLTLNFCEIKAKNQLTLFCVLRIDLGLFKLIWLENSIFMYFLFSLDKNFMNHL